MNNVTSVIFEAMSELCEDDAVLRADKLQVELSEDLIDEVENILMLDNEDERWDLICLAVDRYSNELSKYLY